MPNSLPARTVLTLAATLSCAAQAQVEQCNSTKLSSPLPEFADLRGFGTLPDDSVRIAYLAEGAVDESANLYTVPFDGSRPATLFDLELVDGASLPGFPRFTLDGSRAVYPAEGRTIDIDELYSISTEDGGGNPIRISGDMVEGGEVGFRYAIAADQSTVVYIADQEVLGRDELFKTTVLGGIVTKLNGPLGDGGLVEDDFQLTTDGLYVVYRARESLDAPYELFSVRIADGVISPLNAPLDEGQEIDDFVLTLDGTEVIYFLEGDGVGDSAVIKVPAAGGARQTLSGAELAGETRPFRPAISPDGLRLIYRTVTGTGFATTRDLYSVPVDGSAEPVRLNGPLPGASTEIRDYEISPDSQWVAFVGNQASRSIQDLHTVPIAGGTVTKISSMLEDSNRVADVEFTPDSRRVIFEADQRVPFTRELFSAPVAGGAAIRLNPDLAEDGDVRSFQIAPDGRSVLYSAEQETQFVEELYSVSVGGGRLFKINAPLPEGGEVGGVLGADFNISPDGKLVAYAAEQDSATQIELYVALLNCGLIFEDGFE